jgi:uncharacterized protein involved in exopolysaccharide biosynthesis
LSDIHLPSAPDSDEDGDQPEVRLELTRAGVEQVLSLYSQEQGSKRSETEFAISFEDIQQAIQERRQMLAIGLVSGILLGALVLLISTPLYPVSAQIVLERHEVSSEVTSGGPGHGGSAFIATQAEVMASHSVIAGAVASIPRASHLSEDDDGAADAIEWVVATPITGTQVVALGYLGPDAEHGAQLLEAILVSYRSVLANIETQSQQQKLEAKQAEIDLLAKEATEVTAEIDTLRLGHGILGGGEDAAAIQTEILRDYSQQLSDVRSQLISLESRLAAGGEQLAILDPATRALQEQLWQAEANLSRVRLTLMPQHPAVEAAQQEVTVLRRQLRDSSSATPEALKRDIEATAALEKQLLIVYARERDRMAAIEKYRREENVLIGELDRIREMSDERRSELIDQRLVTRLAEAGEVGVTARMIEAPVLPEGAAWPKPMIVLAAGALLGLMGGFTAALISLRKSRDLWSPSPQPGGSGIEIR